MSVSAKGRKSPMAGKRHSAETCLKMSLAKKGKPSGAKGRKFSEQTIKLISQQRKGKKQKPESVEKRRRWIIENNLNCKKVINNNTGEIFKSIKEAAISMGVKHTTLIAQINGQNKNKFNLTYINN